MLPLWLLPVHLYCKMTQTLCEFFSVHSNTFNYSDLFHWMSDFSGGKVKHLSALGMKTKTYGMESAYLPQTILEFHRFRTAESLFDGARKENDGTQVA